MASSGYVSGQIEVVYKRASFTSEQDAIARSVSAARGTEQRQLDFPAAGKLVQILHVEPGTEDAALAVLRANPVVEQASRTAVRHLLSTTAAFTNDPLFLGISVPASPPLYQRPNYGGQWDMHAICAANAWGYGNANSTAQTYPGALGGSNSFPIAIIDTGADTTHPELTSHIIYAESDVGGVTTVGTSAVTDTDGHGTNVAGIAAAIGGNGFGFAGVAYNAPLMIFRVFPNTNCGTKGCDAQGSDVGLAIQHAVAQGAKVISMSLGSPSADSAEETAVAAAVRAGVVVVAASGNESSSMLDYPGADPGVIAVGASGLDDSTSTVTETVASYSNYDASHPATWGLVAPGGTASDANDGDTYHWIENLYTSQAADSSSFCRPDPNVATGQNDCRILIAGTSQATPHVAGAAALLLSVGVAPSNVETLLCNNATNISNVRQGCGRLNVYKAMAAAVGDPSP